MSFEHIFDMRSSIFDICPASKWLSPKVLIISSINYPTLPKVGKCLTMPTIVHQNWFKSDVIRQEIFSKSFSMKNIESQVTYALVLIASLESGVLLVLLVSLIPLRSGPFMTAWTILDHSGLVSYPTRWSLLFIFGFLYWYF